MHVAVNSCTKKISPPFFFLFTNSNWKITQHKENVFCLLKINIIPGIFRAVFGQFFIF